MPISPAFSIAATSDPRVYRISDDSTGSDGALTHRTIYLYDVANSLLQAAITWPIADDTYDIELDYDIALNVVVHWATAASATAYSADQIYAFVQHSKGFLFDLTQDQSSNPSKLQDANYYFNKMKLMVEIDSAEQAISVGEDLFASQKCIERARFIITKQQFFF